MAEHFSMEEMELVKPTFRISVFPKFSAVVKENSGDHEVPVEVGIDRANRARAAHHLGHVFDEATPAGVMVFSCRSGAAEARFKLLHKVAVEGFQSWVSYLTEKIENVIPVRISLSQ